MQDVKLLGLVSELKPVEATPASEDCTSEEVKIAPLFYAASSALNSPEAIASRWTLVQLRDRIARPRWRAALLRLQSFRNIVLLLDITCDLNATVSCRYS